MSIDLTKLNCFHALNRYSYKPEYDATENPTFMGYDKIIQLL
jgi:hypothetical protein